MDQFESELKNGFLEEASQLLGDAEQCFFDLEANPQDVATLEKIFRIAHNIKGSSKAVGFDSLGAFTHEFETFMLKCKNGEIPITGSTISLLLKCNDHIKAWVNSLKENLEAKLENGPLIHEIQSFTPNEEGISSQEVELFQRADQKADPSISCSDSESLPSKDMDSTVDHTPATTVEPMLPVELDGKKNEEKSDLTQKTTVNNASEESIRVSLSRLEKLLNFVGELVILQTVLREQVYSENPQILRRTVHQMNKVTKEIREISMGLRMVPLKQTFQKMKRIVRDTSTLLGKKVNLVLEGENTEVDKTVLEALGDPLVHLIRNAVDHGIETPTERSSKNKAEMGEVILRAYHQGGRLVIDVKDDGGGISAERLKQKALEKGILKSGQNISEKDAINLIFHSGFSTKAQVSEVSGRGVGMDVVKTNIEQIQGEISIETAVNQGSTFKISLPLTLAIIDGMVVASGSERYVIPLSHVHETIRIESKDFKYATGLGEVLLLRGENIPIVRLSHALGKQVNEKSNVEKIAIVVRNQGRPFALVVDDVIGQQQVVIKKIGNEMQSIKGYSGSAILGDGKPALILELGDLVRSTKKPFVPHTNPVNSKQEKQVAA